MTREESFRQESRKSILIGQRQWAILGALLFPMFLLLDAQVIEDPGKFQFFLAMRFATTILLLVLIFLSMRKGALKYTYHLTFAVLFLMVGVIAVFCVLLTGHNSPYYAGINLVLLGLSAVVPLGTIPTLWACLSVLVAYFLLLVVADPVPLREWDWGIVFNNFFFMVSTAVVASIGAFLTERLRRQAFDAKFEQMRANGELRLINSRLQMSHKELAEKSAELERSYRELEDLYSHKSQFLDNMSHELRTPLTCILAPVQALREQEGRLDPEMADMMEDIHLSAWQLYELINDLLDFSRDGVEDRKLNWEKVNLSQVVSEQIRSWHFMAREKSISLEWSPLEQELAVFFDRREMGKVFRNLLSNAIKFTPEGGFVRVSLKRDDDHFVLSIQDSGIGISKENLAEIFKPFFQVDSSKTRMFEGTGIGLALVKSIVERHYGEIFVDSVLEKGTTFKIRMPIEASEVLNRGVVEPSIAEKVPAGAVSTSTLRAPQRNPGEMTSNVELRVEPAATTSDTYEISSSPDFEAETVTHVLAEEEALSPSSALMKALQEKGGNTTRETHGRLSPKLLSEALDEVPSFDSGRQLEPVDLPEPGDEEETLDDFEVPAYLGKPMVPSFFDQPLERQPQKPRVLVIDDQARMRKLLKRILHEKYIISTASTGREGLEMIQLELPDAVISDVMMPEMTGLQLVEELRKNPMTERLPVLLLTARAAGEDRVHGLRTGANDYLTKPFLPAELLERVKILLRNREHENYLTILNEKLVGRSSDLERKLQNLFMSTLRTVIAAVEAKDPYTAGHSERVAHYSCVLGRAAGLSRAQLKTLELGALLHDVGKIGVPDAILKKPGRLEPDEIQLIKSHTVMGVDILQKAPELHELEEYARWHHERWDGQGYPDGLQKEEIPWPVRLLALADCWDAMTSDRVYRKGLGREKARDIISKLGGTQFDPRVVKLFMDNWEEMRPPLQLDPYHSSTSPREPFLEPQVLSFQISDLLTSHSDP
jgi:response regulator RpfG family c-di-GMP phosphodiesterase/signal transduction histidine kinase